MKPLSERLLAGADLIFASGITRRGPRHRVAELLREAADLARRVESAPTGELYVSHRDPGEFAIADADSLAINLAHLAGKRVALVDDSDG